MVFFLVFVGTTTLAPVRAGQMDEPTVQKKPLGASVNALIASRARDYDLDVPRTTRVAICESGASQYDKDGRLLRGRVNPSDVGIFQINEKYHLAMSKKLGFDIHTTEGNIEYALWLMKNEGIQHWNASRSCWS